MFSNFLEHQKFQKSPELSEQLRAQIELDYEQTRKLLNETHVLEFSPEQNVFGIRDAEGIFYPYPSLEAVFDLYRAHHQLMSEKREQGFTKLQLTPIAMPLFRLSHYVETALNNHLQRRQLFYADSSPILPTGDQGIPLQWGYFLKRGDPEILYFPRTYFGDRDSLTKAQVIALTQQTSSPGWSVCFIEDKISLDRTLEELDEAMKAHRLPLRKGWSPARYLKDLNREDSYIGETGFTIEDFLTHLLLHLQATNMIDASATHTYCIGNSIGRASIQTYWDRVSKDLYLGDIEANSTGYAGCRTAVRLNGPEAMLKRKRTYAQSDGRDEI